MSHLYGQNETIVYLPRHKAMLGHRLFPTPLLKKKIPLAKARRLRPHVPRSQRPVNPFRITPFDASRTAQTSLDGWVLKKK